MHFFQILSTPAMFDYIITRFRFIVASFNQSNLKVLLAIPDHRKINCS